MGKKPNLKIQMNFKHEKMLNLTHSIGNIHYSYKDIPLLTYLVCKIKKSLIIHWVGEGVRKQALICCCGNVY